MDICKVVGIPCASKDQAAKALSDAVLALGKEVGIDMNFQSIIPDKALYDSKLEEIAYLAYEDQCTPANPRVPLIPDMIQILKDAYQGN